MQPAQHDNPQHRPPRAIQSPVAMARGGVWHSTLLHAILLGLLGALIAWAVGEIPQRWSQTSLEDFAAYQIAAEKIGQAVRGGDLTPAEGVEATNKLNHVHAGDPYVKIVNNRDLPAKRKTYEIDRMQFQDRWRSRMGHLAWFSTVGLILGLFLGSAEPMAARNARAVGHHAVAGAVCGLAGGFLVCVFINDLYRAVPAGQVDGLGMARQIVGRVASWAALGLFLAPAPGILLRNMKRLEIALAAGALGGLVGGALFEPACLFTGSAVTGRLIALVAIGVLAGLSTSLIENAARTGWLAVVAGGRIAGKQFVLYRKVTCLGSSPANEIRLSNDPQIAPRHAAIRAVAGGYEIEDLHAGSGTLLNGRPIDQALLTNGDLVQIGGTCLLFQQKARPPVSGPAATAKPACFPTDGSA